MKIGYVRVSTLEQNTARQEDLMEKLGVERIYIEKVTGRRRDVRPELRNMMDYIREGDVVVVESLSRLARSTKDLLNIVEELAAKGVELVSQKEILDTKTPQGKFVLTVFAALSELEADQIAQRRDEGIAIAKAEGKYKGRQPIRIADELLENVHTRWYKGEITAKHAAELLGVSRRTFYRKVWEYEDERGIPRKGEQ